MGRYFLERPYLAAALVLIGLIALPIAVWLDLRDLSDQNLRRQAASMNQVISSVRSYYGTNVVGRVLSAEGETEVRYDYHDHPGAIPIPATLSIELGTLIGDSTSGDVDYRFVSDYPFRSRPSHDLSTFETRALAGFRASRDPDAMLVETEGSLFGRHITLATPVIMGEACVSCHNTHPESPRTDWQVGDVRGIQTVSVQQPITLGIGSFKWLLAYFALAGTVGLVFAALQFRLAGSFARLNEQLEASNAFLAGVSMKISRYLSPQVYRSIFAGERDVAISTERKKLTVFFSDIKDFTSTTERLQPEEITALLNEYFTEMSRIADAHGATVDKFVGDAIIAFFGDPETRGVAEDARACVGMAIAMQHRLDELAVSWRERGIEHPFQARMGINTGYCNVGNFGSDERMDYTIIGAEANLSARLESVAPPGGIVLSYETYVHVSDLFEARRLEPMQFKGIPREIVAYEICIPEADEMLAETLDETIRGMSLRLNSTELDGTARSQARVLLRRALRSIEQA